MNEKSASARLRRDTKQRFDAQISKIGIDAPYIYVAPHAL